MNEGNMNKTLLQGKEINKSNKTDEISSTEASDIILSEKLKANDIALNIIKASQFMLEKILFGEKNETTIQKFIKKIKVEIVCKEFKDFNLDLYDEPFKYYNDLQKYLFYILESQDLENYFNYFVDESFKKSYISIYYFSVLIDLLIELLTTNPLAHQDNIIKFYISMICEFFRGKKYETLLL